MSSNFSTRSSSVMISDANCFSLMAILQNEHISPFSIGTGFISVEEQAIRNTNKNEIDLSGFSIFKINFLQCLAAIFRFAAEVSASFDCD